MTEPLELTDPDGLGSVETVAAAAHSAGKTLPPTSASGSFRRDASMLPTSPAVPIVEVTRPGPPVPSPPIPRAAPAPEKPRPPVPTPPRAEVGTATRRDPQVGSRAADPGVAQPGAPATEAMTDPTELRRLEAALRQPLLLALIALSAVLVGLGAVLLWRRFS